MASDRRPVRRAGTGDGRPPHASDPLPLDRAILWTPRGLTSTSFPEDVYPVFLEHDTLAGVNRHLDRIDREPRFGFLLGRLFRCPELEIDYAVVDTAVAAREVLSEEASGACIIRAWSEAQAVFSGHSGLLLGWYHSHYRFGLAPTEADRDTNARYFDAPWQLSIIAVPDRARPLGGVFRRPAGDADGDHDRPSPFYELTPTPHGGAIGRAHSAVTWANYEARPPAAPVFGPAALPEPEVPPEPEPAAAVEPEAAAEPESVTEAREVDAPPPAHEQIADEEPSIQREEGVAEEPVAEVKAPEKPLRAPKKSKKEAAGSSKPAKPGRPANQPRVTLWSDEQRAAANREVPTGSAPPPPAASRPPELAAPEPPPPSERPEPGPRRPSEGPRPPAALPDDRVPVGERSLRGVPLVLPGEKNEVGLLPPRARRIAWPVVAAGVVLLSAALFLLRPDPPPGPVGRGGPETSTTGGAAASAELRRFLEEADALEIAGERYRERATDFDAGRIGCDLLTTGYLAADEAYVRAAAAYAGFEDRSNPRAADAYEEAGAEIAGINSHFDESGCPRP